MSNPRTPPPSEGYTDGLGNFSGIRQSDSVGSELAGGLADTPLVGPAADTDPDPFDGLDAYPHGAELAGRWADHRAADAG